MDTATNVPRTIFYTIVVFAPFLIWGLATMWSPFIWLSGFYAVYVVIGLYDLWCASHNVLHNYPVIGHFRYIFEFVSPEIRQYFVETNQNGRPFNRIMRNLVYRRARDEDDTLPFGTQYDLYEVGYNRSNHSLAPQEVSEEEGRVMLGGPDCKQPYSASRLNISAMSFGALSPNALRALNAGAKRGGFAHNTGEGGLSRYHLEEGGDLVWQIGTGYFGCRTKDGNFDDAQFKEKAASDKVKAIEIKLSQGAKPAHGGVLPAAKVNEEIAKARGVEVGKDVISPPAHSAFSTPLELIEFVKNLRELSGGKPIGFKLCIGYHEEFMGICKAMLKTGITPDFITVDGAEGGTGAAPVEYSNRLGVPLNEGLSFVHNCLVGAGLRERVIIIASGKVASGYDMIEKMALGADICNAARTMLFALGCIQALHCNTNKCPTGIATQDKTRMRAVNVDEKQVHVANYHRRTMESFLDMVGAMGYTSPNQLCPDDIKRRVSDENEKPYSMIYPYLVENCILNSTAPEEFMKPWNLASSTAFSSNL